MTVAELIAALQQAPQDARVITERGVDEDWYDVDAIEVTQMHDLGSNYADHDKWCGNKGPWCKSKPLVTVVKI